MVRTSVGRRCRQAFLAGALLSALGSGSPAQTSQPSEDQPSDAPPVAEPQPDTPKAPAAKAAPYTSKAWGARLEPEPPGYVNTLDKSGIPGFENVDWLEFGLEQTTRFELRRDIRMPELENDEQFLLRSRVYLGVKKILDPLRFGIEFQDSRQFMSDFPDRDRDVDEADFLQAFVELYFADALGKDYPIQFRAGRMSFEYVDRRLVGRNRWRNTTNSFDGFRLRLGQPSADWQFDVFAVQPVARYMTSRDRPDEERWFYGMVGAWRRWSSYVTLEPYYFILDEDRKDPDSADREIHTLGLHAFGPIGNTRFDYDFDTAFQFGKDGDRTHRAFAIYGEAGYTFDHAWRPRLSLSTAYASGDRDPDDDRSERFDKLFQVGHPYSTTDFFSWQNTISPKIRLSMRPTSKLSVDTSYGAYWLASDDDAWVNAKRQDVDGRSGSFVGQELELRVRYKVTKHIDLETGYSHFFPGSFVGNTGEADDGDLFYVQTTIHY